MLSKCYSQQSVTTSFLVLNRLALPVPNNVPPPRMNELEPSLVEGGKVRDLRTLMELFSICMHSKKVSEIVFAFSFLYTFVCEFLWHNTTSPSKGVSIYFSGNLFSFQSKILVGAYRDEQIEHFRWPCSQRNDQEIEQLMEGGWGFSTGPVIPIYSSWTFGKAQLESRRTCVAWIHINGVVGLTWCVMHWWHLGGVTEKPGGNLWVTGFRFNKKCTGNLVDFFI